LSPARVRDHIAGPFIWLWVAIAVLLALAFKPVVENDGAYYFVYLHAVVVDHTFNVATELPHVYSSKSDWFPIGSAVLSLPAYLVALLVGGSSRRAFDSYYTAAYVIASLLYGLLALAISHRMAVRVTGSVKAAAIGLAAGALTTPFVYYVLYEPSYSHTFSAFATATFLYIWWRSRDRSIAGWLWLGALGGLMAAVRFQDGALMAIALLDIPRARWRVLLMIPTAALVFAPQALVDLAQWGTLWPQRSAAQALTPLPGHYLEVLFSSHNGLFVWHPALLAAVAGLATLRDKRLLGAAVIAFVAETAIDGALPDWPGGFAFGGRRFLALTPFFVIGFAELALHMRAWVAWSWTAAFSAWNVVLMANLTYVVVGDRDPGYLGLLLGQARALAFVPREFVQGEVVRDLLLWPVLHQPFRPASGVVLLVLVSISAAIFVWLVAGNVRPEPSPHSPTDRDPRLEHARRPR
jgi:hypothetical protein